MPDSIHITGLSGHQITRIFREMTRKEGITVVMTTHDVGLMGAGDQIIELENGGRIYS